MNIPFTQSFLFVTFLLFCLLEEERSDQLKERKKKKNTIKNTFALQNFTLIQIQLGCPFTLLNRAVRVHYHTVCPKSFSFLEFCFILQTFSSW